MLVEKGKADPLLVNPLNGFTALQYARIYNPNPLSIEYLRQQQGDAMMD